MAGARPRRRGGRAALPVAEVVTTYRCPHCGGALELLELRREACIACWRCLRVACVSARKLRRLYMTRQRFDWRGMVLAMYRLYLTARA